MSEYELEYKVAMDKVAQAERDYKTLPFEDFMYKYLRGERAAYWIFMLTKPSFEEYMYER